MLSDVNRFFTLAVMKLKKEQQREIFVRLVELLTIASKKNGPHDEKAIHLLARGVCLAAHVVRMFTNITNILIYSHRF